MDPLFSTSHRPPPQEVHRQKAKPDIVQRGTGDDTVLNTDSLGRFVRLATAQSAIQGHQLFSDSYYTQSGITGENFRISWNRSLS